MVSPATAQVPLPPTGPLRAPRAAGDCSEPIPGEQPAPPRQKPLPTGRCPGSPRCLGSPGWSLGHVPPSVPVPQPPARWGTAALPSHRHSPAAPGARMLPKPPWPWRSCLCFQLGSHPCKGVLGEGTARAVPALHPWHPPAHFLISSVPAQGGGGGGGRTRPLRSSGDLFPEEGAAAGP